MVLPLIIQAETPERSARRHFVFIADADRDVKLYALLRM